MDYLGIIDQYYAEDNALRRLLLKHSQQVAERCLLIASRHPELHLDTTFLREAAMLHDIGVRWCHAPSIFCMGDEPYIRHGLIGGRLLRQLGFERHARVCERHTGTGLTRQQILRQQLPLPLPDGDEHRPPLTADAPSTAPDEPYVPQTLEEQVICYADKFYSKSHPDRDSSVSQVADGLLRFGPEGVALFLEWAARFE